MKSVRWIGGLSILLGVTLPIAVLYQRASAWEEKEPVIQEVDGEKREALRPEMVLIEAAGRSFVMGSPETERYRDFDEDQREVSFERNWLVSRTEITQAQFKSVLDEDPMTSDYCKSAGLGDDLPVVCVSWIDALRYCNELSEREGWTPVYEISGETATWNQEADGYRLLTEEEWEYVARAGTDTVYVGTNKESEACDYANVADVSVKERPDWESGWPTFSCNDGFRELAPVDAKPPNRWQLLGMGGNAAEWVWDPFEVDPDPTPYRVFRGGSWRYGPQDARVAYRDWWPPSNRYDYVGFRVVRSLPSSS